MKKRNYWPLFFIGIFSFVFMMIIWTIYSASQVPVYQDESFLSTYHDVDRDYNKIALSNVEFEKKYDFELIINGKAFPLTFKDMFLAQRVIELKSEHKDIFRVGKNIINLRITEKNSDKVLKDLDAELMIAVPTNNNYVVNLNSKNFTYSNDLHKAVFELPYKGNWNITGRFKVNKDLGYFFIKSNAI